MEERHLECSQCKKKATIVYQEVIGKHITLYHMCNKCPVLKQKLEGKKDPTAFKTAQKEESLCCNFCQTSLDSILLGQLVGCKECYQVFQDVLIDQLFSTNHIAPHIKVSQKNKKASFHSGKSPDTNQKTLDSNRLSSLNADLSDALKRENYEQAAWLRDQINVLMEKPNE